MEKIRGFLFLIFFHYVFAFTYYLRRCLSENISSRDDYVSFTTFSGFQI